jgi:hypothetical protein
MKTRALLLFSGLLLSLLIVSCEREIEIDLGENEETIVVEGIIEAGGNPRVLVSKNRGFFNNFPSDIFALLEEFIIKDAIVTVSDGPNTYLLNLDSNFVYPYIYYTTNALVGEVGKTYVLTVQALGKTATARTTIPPPVPVDSLYFGLNVFDVNEDSLGFLYATYKDPDTLGNAYRLYAKKSSETQYFPVNGAITNDDFINGKNVTFFSGQSNKPFAVQDTFIDQDFFYRLGDTIQIKFCSIGNREFEFYNTFEAALGTNGNPFASPIIIKSNIEGGLGVWCGQSYFSDTLIATQ